MYYWLKKRCWTCVTNLMVDKHVKKLATTENNWETSSTHKKLKWKKVKALWVFFLKILVSVMPPLNQSISYTVR